MESASLAHAHTTQTVHEACRDQLADRCRDRNHSRSEACTLVLAPIARSCTGTQGIPTFLQNEKKGREWVICTFGIPVKLQRWPLLRRTWHGYSRTIPGEFRIWTDDNFHRPRCFSRRLKSKLSFPRIQPESAQRLQFPKKIGPANGPPPRGRGDNFPPGVARGYLARPEPRLKPGKLSTIYGDIWCARVYRGIPGTHGHIGHAGCLPKCTPVHVVLPNAPGQ